MARLERVLYVDDEADIRTVVQMALEVFGGIAVTLCASGTEALARLDAARPELILLDVMMPGMDGPSLLARMQALPGGLPAPVVFLTAKAMPEEVAQLKSLGAIAVIAKPFDALTLAAQLQRLWQQHEAASLPITPWTHPPAGLAAELMRLEREFRADLPRRLTQLQSLWESYRAAPTPAGLADMHRAAHSIVGSAATLRADTVATAARALEQLLKALWEGDAMTPPTAAQIDAALSRLGLLMMTVASRAGEPPPIEVAARPLPPAAPADPGGTAIAWLSAQGPPAALTHQLEGFGYRLLDCSTPAAFDAVLSGDPPQALLVDLDAWPADADIRLRTLSSQGLPVLVLESGGSFAQRLAAVRGGAAGYLCKPLDVVQLSVALDRHALQTPEPPYRVLLVDDEVAVASYHAAILREHGVVVEHVHSALLVQGLLEEFMPDVIVTDVYMPDAGGIELARVLRQMERYDHIPIVFLSSETNTDLQQLAVGFGADDFLVKPVMPEHFVATLVNRGRRARALAAAMTHDGLTGLLNHKSAKALLEQELARAQRSGRALALALLDVDHFKRVNDVQGHLAGDRVLAGLARLLLRRLRRGDHVCRYGGEEFLLILPEATAATAVAVVDTLRQAFGAVHFSGRDGDFSVTFSAGVAISCVDDSAESLLNAADCALYAAKNGGRNRVLPTARADAD